MRGWLLVALLAVASPVWAQAPVAVPVSPPIVAPVLAPIPELLRLRVETKLQTQQIVTLSMDLAAAKAQITVLANVLNAQFTTERGALEVELLAAAHAPTGWIWDWQAMQPKAPEKPPESPKK